MGNIVLTNATIIDCTGADPRPNGWVVIEDQRIKEVGHGRPGVLPAKAEVIDCHGQTLLPGLIDGHVHTGSVEARDGSRRKPFFLSSDSALSF